MSKQHRKKKSDNQNEHLASTFNLIAAILNLIVTLLVAIEKLLE